MPAAGSAVDYVYQGVWVNWSKGSLMGSTLTVNEYHASILSPALALFVSIAGAQLWGVFQFALHQFRATASARSLLYHQQQIILRNTSTDLNTLWRLIRVAIAWRHQPDAHALKVSLPLVFWATLHFALIALAGLFSSWALEAGNEVLSRSPHCGYFSNAYQNQLANPNISDPEVVRLNMQEGNWMNSRFVAVQQHVDLCYQNPQECAGLVVQNLTSTWRIIENGCPFDQAVCHPDIDGSIAFDTGYISSSAALGLNTKKEDRISFRMLAECAPLNDANHSTGWQTSSSSTGQAGGVTAGLLYGPSFNDANNATYTLTQQNLQCGQRMITQPYSLASVMAFPGGTTSAGTASFDPIAELQLTEADLSLIMMSYLDAYYDPVSDPWFSAHQAKNDSDAFCLQQQQQRVLYTKDQPLSTIGCTQQWQICNTDNPSQNSATASHQCTPLSAWSQTNSSINEPSGTESTMSLSAAQRALAQRILAAAEPSTFYWVVSSLSQGSTPPLRARYMMSDTVAAALPNNQWQTETKYWVDIILNYFQQSILDTSTGQFAADTSYIAAAQPSKNDPTQNANYQLCKNQIIRSDAYRNFNFFALMLTVVICTIIIIIGLCIEDVISFVRQRRLNYSGPDGRQDMWVANNVLEMLKTIDETKNASAWTRSKNGVPVTNNAYHVGVCDLTNQNIIVQPGHGTINSSTIKYRSSIPVQGQKHLYEIDQGHSHERCPSCSSFEVSPGGSSHQNASPTSDQSAIRSKFNPFRHSPPALVNEPTALTYVNPYLNRLSLDDAHGNHDAHRKQRQPAGWGVLPA